MARKQARASGKAPDVRNPGERGKRLQGLAVALGIGLLVYAGLQVLTVVERRRLQLRLHAAVEWRPEARLEEAGVRRNADDEEGGGERKVDVGADGRVEKEQAEGARKAAEVYKGMKSLGHVEVQTWREDDAFLRELVLARRPVLIKGAPAEAWASWQVTDLEAALPELEDVRLQAGPVFTLRSERDAGGMLDDGVPAVTSILPKVPSRVFRGTAERSDGFLYWTQDASVLEASPLDIGARSAPGNATGSATAAEATINRSGAGNHRWRRWAVKEVQLEDGEFAGAHIDDLIMPMLWLSQPGVVAQAHYDKSHNFVTQIFGTKRWLIFPPFQHFRLYQFPHLHPSYKQSQVDFSAPDLSRFPQFRGAQAFEAIVNPGDVLYMPPFWFHRVRTESLSLSLSVVSPSQEEVVLSEAYWRDLPFGGLDTTPERVLGARKYLLELLARLKGVKSPRWFANRLYDQRYAALFPMDSLFMQKRLAGFDCYLSDTDFLTGASLAETVTNAIGEEEIRSAAAFVAECANDAVIDPAVREQWAQSYVEELARWATGNPDDAVLFLRGCLGKETHLSVAEEVEWLEGPEVITVGENAVEGDWVEPAEQRRRERRRRAQQRAARGRPDRKPKASQL